MALIDASKLEFDDWSVVRKFLPQGWEEQARLTGALRRTRRIQSAEALLRILLLHLANGCSLVETAARARAAGLGSISAVGVFKRLRAAGPWLRWLAQQERGLAALPIHTVGRRVRAVDASTVAEPGATGSTWRLHWALNLGDLQCDFFEITPREKSGESFWRVPVLAGDILLGDRIYAAPPGIAHVRKGGGDVIVRLNRSALPLFADNGDRIDVLGLLKGLGPTDSQEFPATIRTKAGEQYPGRLIALRQSAEAALRIRKKLKAKAWRGQYRLTEEALAMADYFALWTSVQEMDKGEVLELYRLRWQIELVFKRMKSILGLGHLPKSDPQSAHAWLEGKVLVGLLIERMVDAAASSFPWGYPLATPPQSLARNRTHVSPSS